MGARRVVLPMKKLCPEACWPSFGTPGSAGLDLFCLEGAMLRPGQHAMIRTGIAVAIPAGHVGLIKPRSSTFKRGLDLDGTVDSDYRGELFLSVWHRGEEPFAVEPGDRIAQLVIVPAPSLYLVVVNDLGETPRSAKGFGSTGR